MQQAIDWAKGQGYQVVMVTFTFPHKSWQSLGDLLARQADAFKRLRKGIRLEDGWVNPDRVKVNSSTESRSMLTVVLHSGRNRVIRRMFEQVGHPVRRLTRTHIGPLRLGQLKLGETRELTRDELGSLLDAVKL